MARSRGGGGGGHVVGTFSRRDLGEPTMQGFEFTFLHDFGMSWIGLGYAVADSSGGPTTTRPSRMHARPQLLPVLDAAERHLHHCLHLPLVRARHGRVHHLHERAPCHLLPHDAREVVWRLRGQVLAAREAPAPADELKDRHAVAVHVELDGHPAERYQRRHVPGRAPPAVVDAGHVLRDGHGDAEVRHVRPEAAGKEDVGWLDVEVEDLPVALVVEVRERPGDVDGDAPPRRPRQEAPPLLAVEQPPVQRPVLQERVDQVLAAAPAQEAVPEEAHQAAVVHACDDGDLSQEDSLADGLVAGDPLDGDQRAVVEEASEDFAGAAAPQHGPEVSGHGSDLVVRELPRQLLDVERGLLHRITTPCFFSQHRQFKWRVGINLCSCAMRTKLPYAVYR
ncbi:hypothetical protein SEVIR_5G252550v4 [Setaria viridis]